MNSSDKIQNDNGREYRRHNWSIMFAGLMLCMVGMHLIVVRPLKLRIDELGHEVAISRTAIQQVAGIGTQIQETTAFMASVRSQQAKIEETRAALDSIAVFREQVAAECDKSLDALISLDNLSTVHHMLNVQRVEAERAMVAIDEIAAMQHKLAELKTMINQDSHDLAAADTAARGLLAMKDELVWRGTNTSMARENAQRLMLLRDDLGSERLDFETAGRNLESLLTMQTKLSSRRMSVTAKPSRMSIASIRKAIDKSISKDQQQLIKSMLVSRLIPMAQPISLARTGLTQATYASLKAPAKEQREVTRISQAIDRDETEYTISPKTAPFPQEEYDPTFESPLLWGMED